MPTAENKTIVRRYFEEFHNQRNLGIAPEIAPAETVDAIRGLAMMMQSAFPDYQLVIKEQIAEGDVVATVWEGHGTHQGEWPSPIGPIPPSGKHVTWTATTTLRVRDGKIVETIGTNWDHLGILQQMGALPAAAPRSGA